MPKDRGEWRNIMMKCNEILFRGMDVHKNWHAGLLLHLGNAWYIFDETEVLFEVIPSTIGQYIGLTDINGKKIFDGDMIQHYNNDPYTEVDEVGYVFLGKKDCRWCRTSSNKPNFPGGAIPISQECRYEVIGNIHIREGKGLL